MRKKRVMVVGPTGSGKTTLVHALDEEEKPVKRTQDMLYGKNTIDVPGSYIENAWMYRNLITASQDASHVLIVVDQSKAAAVYSPGFAKVFRCPVVGVIMKTDLMPENEEFCVRQLRLIGVAEPYYRISLKNGAGLGALKEYLWKGTQP